MFSQCSPSTLRRYTVLFVLFGAAVFVLAAAIRAFSLSVDYVSASNVTRRKLFKRRAVHSLVILGTISYLQVCSLACLLAWCCCVIDRVSVCWSVVRLFNAN